MNCNTTHYRANSSSVPGDPTPARSRIARALGGESVLDALSERLSPRDLTSLLLEVIGRRARARTAGDVLRDHERIASTRWPAVDARRLRAAEDVYIAAAEREGFVLVEIPPVVPLGATHALGGTHPNNVLASVRGVEVVADPTVAFALEAARRRRSSLERDETIRFCGGARVMRMQPLAVEGLLPHFRLFALATALRGGVLEELARHARAHVAALTALGVRDVAVEVADVEAVSAMLRARGVAPGELRVRAHDFADSHAALAARGITLPKARAGEMSDALAELPRAVRERMLALDAVVLEPLAGVARALDLGRLEGIGYYRGPCLRVSGTTNAGRWPLADGGALDWTARLLSDGRETFVTSGVGLDLLARVE